MEIPRQIGPYRPLDHLGSGGMGEVYLARAPDGSLLAVKTIRADLITRPDLRVRLRREAEAMSRVSGEHLAELVAYDLDAEPPYLATRYVQGRSLRDLVAEEGPLPRAALWRLADGLARALAGVHGAGYLHRDLKPANVMVVDGSPVVIDFGISHALDETRLSRHGRASGTPAYMAPELVAEGRAEPAGDVYSWAATIAYAATGRDAHWSALGPVALAKALFSTDGLSPNFREILDAAFASDPGDRPSAGELVECLARLAPVTGADLHLDHPYEAGATTVTFTLPGGRQVSLNLPPDAEAGTTLHFPGQGRLGRNGGPPGILHLHLISPKDFPPVVAESVLARPGVRRSRRTSLLLLPLLLFGVAAFIIRTGSAADEGEEIRRTGDPPSAARQTLLYLDVPRNCRLLSAARVRELVPGAKFSNVKMNGSESSISCGISEGGRGLVVRLSLVGAAPHAGAAEVTEGVFQSDLENEEKSPYSEVTSTDLGLGDRSFSYVRDEMLSYVGEGAEVVADENVFMGVEVLNGNLIMSALLYQTPGGRQGSAERRWFEAQLKSLMREAVAALPNQTTATTPSP